MDENTWGTIVRPALVLIALFVIVRIVKARRDKNEDKRERQ